MLELLDGHVFRKADFTETRDGQCRILPPLTHHLASSMPIWAAVAAPYAEAVADGLAEASELPIAKRTPLTSKKRRATAEETSAPRRKAPGSPQRRANRVRRVDPIAPTCQGCGTLLTHHQRRWCPDCWVGQRRNAGRRGSKIARGALVDDEAWQVRGAAVARGKKTVPAEEARRAGWEPDMSATGSRPAAQLSLLGNWLAENVSLPSSMNRRRLVLMLASRR